MTNKENLKEFVAFLKQYNVPLNADKTLNDKGKNATCIERCARAGR